MTPYYEEKYKLMWQVCCMTEIENKCDEMTYLRALTNQNNDDGEL